MSRERPTPLRPHAEEMGSPPREKVSVARKRKDNAGQTINQQMFTNSYFCLAQTGKDLFHRQAILTGPDPSRPPLPGTCLVVWITHVLVGIMFPYLTVISWRAGTKFSVLLSVTAPTYKVQAYTFLLFSKTAENIFLQLDVHPEK